MEINKENNAFYVKKGLGSDLPSVPTHVATVEGEATTRVLNASFNILGRVNKRREKEDQNHWNDIRGREIPLQELQTTVQQGTFQEDRGVTAIQHLSGDEQAARHYAE